MKEEDDSLNLKWDFDDNAEAKIGNWKKVIDKFR